MKKNGFTLLETLIYIGLFSLMVSGVITSLFAIGVSADMSATDAAISDEGMWLMQQMKSGSSTFSAVSHTLVQNKLGTSEVISGNDYSVEEFQWQEQGPSNNEPHSVLVTFTLLSYTGSGYARSQVFSAVLYPLP